MSEPTPFEAYESGVLLHGTKADLKAGDLLVPGRGSNFQAGRTTNHVYVTATLDAATWGAELAFGEGRGRIYVVEATGDLEDDPNVTDKKFPGNPTSAQTHRADRFLRLSAQQPRRTMWAAGAVRRPRHRPSRLRTSNGITLPPTVRGRRRHVQAGRGLPERHPTLNRLTERQPPRRSELRSTVQLHPGPPRK
jgi:rifampin ADP-ribosylating transferase